MEAIVTSIINGKMETVKIVFPNDFCFKNWLSHMQEISNHYGRVETFHAHAPGEIQH